MGGGGGVGGVLFIPYSNRVQLSACGLLVLSVGDLEVCNKAFVWACVAQHGGHALKIFTKSLFHHRLYNRDWKPAYAQYWHFLLRIYRPSNG